MIANHLLFGNRYIIIDYSLKDKWDQMKQTRDKRQNFLFRHSSLLFFFFCFFCGVILFILLFGVDSLKVSNTQWIYQRGGDILHSQLGWEWFRQEPWHFPVGWIDSYGYPFGTSIYFTDSIPLLSVVLKVFSGILPVEFQFFGIWQLINLVGQLFVGALIINEFSQSITKQLLCGALLVFSPIFLYRTFGHDALAAQWILLSGIFFAIKEYKQKLWRFAWPLLFSATILIHAYLVAMLVPIWAASLVIHYEREKNTLFIIRNIFMVIIASLVLAWLFGLFGISSDQLGQGGFGKFSWNLNGFINPHNFSLFLEPMPLTSDLQNEGFSYLGLGNLLLFPVAVYGFLRNHLYRGKVRIFILFIMISLFYIIYALSNAVYINEQLLFKTEVTLIEYTIYSIFRVLGRFIWPVFYFVVLFSLVHIVKLPKFGVPILICALILQAIDIYPLYSQKRAIYADNYHSPLQSEFWRAAADTCQHVVILPAKSAAAIYEPFAIFSRQNAMTLNWGYFSRGEYTDIENLGNQTWSGMMQGTADDSTLYVIWGEEWIEEAEDTLAGKIPLCTVDGYLVAFSENNGLMQSGLDLADYCILP